jgi:hypothetical protein
MHFRFSSTLILLLLTGNLLRSQTELFLDGTHQARPGYGTFLELKFPRNAIKGVARFTHSLPDGWTVQALTQENAYTITQEGNTVRILWLSVPLVDTLRCSWFIKIPETATGGYEINGKLQFFENGIQKELKAEPFPIKLNRYFSRVSFNKPRSVSSETTPVLKEPGSEKKANSN